jgi:hypothetical protein
VCSLLTTIATKLMPCRPVVRLCVVYFFTKLPAGADVCYLRRSQQNQAAFLFTLCYSSYSILLIILVKPNELN